MLNLNRIVNINLFTNDEAIKKYVLGKIESGQNIIVSNLPLGQYVCSCQIGDYAIFQRVPTIVLQTMQLFETVG